MKNNLPLAIQKAVCNYEEIQTDGLTMYPITMREYDEWQIARAAIEALQQSFPVRFMSVPLLEAYFQMDVILPAMGEGKPTGLLGCALLALSLTLRIGCGLAPDKRIAVWSPAVDRKGDKLRLKSFRAMLNGEEIIEITPVLFQRLRPIIAAQNGAELESDEANPELVRAEREIAAQGHTTLDIDADRRMSYVAAKLHMRKRDFLDWPIREFEDAADVLTQEVMFSAFAAAAAMGGFGDKGNPVPHPYYRKANEESSHMALSSFAGGEGLKAVARASSGKEP